MENLRSHLAHRLRRLMSDTQGLDTQTRVAKKAGVSQSTVQRILAEEQGATVDVLEQLADAFGIKNAAYLLLGDDEVAMLTDWSKVDDDGRSKVRGFMQVVGYATSSPRGPLKTPSDPRAYARALAHAFLSEDEARDGIPPAVQRAQRAAAKR